MCTVMMMMMLLPSLKSRVHCVICGSDDILMGDEEDDDTVVGNDVGVSVGDGDALHRLRIFRVLYCDDGSFSGVAITLLLLLLLHHCHRPCCVIVFVVHDCC